MIQLPLHGRMKDISLNSNLMRYNNLIDNTKSDILLINLMTTAILPKCDLLMFRLAMPFLEHKTKETKDEAFKLYQHNSGGIP